MCLPVDEQKILAGYVMDRNLPGVTTADARRLTHLNVAFGLVRDHRIQTGLFTGTGDLFRISTAASVHLFLEAGIPRGKIVIGAAFYARKWSNVPDKNHGLYQMSPSFGGHGARYTQLVSDFIDKNSFV